MSDIMMQLFGFQPSSSIVKRLCDLSISQWRQGDEEEQWATKAIESLLKKLKKEKGAAERLENALKCRHTATECVTIQRSLDGRLQVNHRKGLPHVIYCRVWRWPDLQTHQELKSLPSCEYPYSNKQNTVCVNPYHYDRVEGNVLPPVLVPRYSDRPERRESRRPRAQHLLSSSISYMLGMMQQQQPQQQPPQCQQLTAAARGPTMVLPPGFVVPPQPFVVSPVPSSGVSLPGSPYASCVMDEDVMQTDDMSHHMTASQYSQMAWPNMDGGDQMEIDPNSISKISAFQFDFEQAPEPAYWCTISYYELNSRVGEIFNVPSFSLTVTVDGFTNPDVNRFCLGRFTNVHRDRNVKTVRDSIGKGIILTNHDGQVFVECLSDYAVFVQSANCNYFRGFHPSTICKIPPRQTLKIFDPTTFLEALSKKYAEKDDGIYEVEKMCFMRLSFVRGWGAEYQRQCITSTPCWIEIRLNGPFQWYERAISSHPGRILSSMS